MQVTKGAPISAWKCGYSATFTYWGFVQTSIDVKAILTLVVAALFMTTATALATRALSEGRRCQQQKPHSLYIEWIKDLSNINTSSYFSCCGLAIMAVSTSNYVIVTVTVVIMKAVLFPSFHSRLAGKLLQISIRQLLAYRHLGLP